MIGGGANGYFARTCCFLSLCMLMLIVSQADAQNRRPRVGAKNPTAEQAQENPQRPDRRFVRPPSAVDNTRFFAERRGFGEGGEEFRTFNGTFNNLDRPTTSIDPDSDQFLFRCFVWRRQPTVRTTRLPGRMP
jgi:hypothetical protein